MHHVFDVVFVSDKVNAKQTSVTVGRVERLEAVTQFVFHSQLSQTAAQVLEVREGANTDNLNLSMSHSD